MSDGKSMCHCGERDLTPWQPSSPNVQVWLTDERNVRHGLHGCEAQPVRCACGDVLLRNDGHTVRTDYRGLNADLGGVEQEHEFEQCTVRRS